MSDCRSRRLAWHEPATYQIRVEGTLRASWSDRLGGMRISPDADDHRYTMLEGTLPDQSALLGVLKGLNDLRLPLVDVRCLIDCEQQVGSPVRPDC